MSDHGFKYLMRVPQGFCPERDFTIQVLGCDVRVVKVSLSSGSRGLFCCRSL